jgi:hypothetical protein
MSREAYEVGVKLAFASRGIAPYLIGGGVGGVLGSISGGLSDKSWSGAARGAATGAGSSLLGTAAGDLVRHALHSANASRTIAGNVADLAVSLASFYALRNLLQKK